MQILIDNKELDALAYACVYSNLRYYTLPEGPGVSRAMITHKNNKDLDNTEAYYLARLLKERIEYNLSVERLESLPMPNNVLYTVEQIEDLP
jgi:hypothetical protein